MGDDVWRGQTDGSADEDVCFVLFEFKVLSAMRMGMNLGENKKGATKKVLQLSELAVDNAFETK